MGKAVSLALGLIASLICAETSVVAQTTRISVSSSGLEANGPSYQPAVSDDAQVIAFVSGATNLVADDTNAVPDIFVRDRVANTTERVSVGPDGLQSNGASLSPSISANGRWVTFSSTASNLVPDDTNGFVDVFVHDRTTHVTRRISTGSFGQANHASTNPGISADGRVVAFLSDASNLVAGDTNEILDVFASDLTTGAITRISVGTFGQAVAFPSYEEVRTTPSLSADGRFVAFVSGAHLIHGDSALCISGTGAILPEDAIYDCEDTYVHDRTTGHTELYSDARGGRYAQITQDGRRVVWAVPATQILHGLPRCDHSDLAWRDRDSGSLGSTSIVGLVGPPIEPVCAQPFSLSRNGRYLAFEYNAFQTFIRPPSAWVHDFTTSQSIQVDRGSSAQAVNAPTFGIVVSANGQFVALVSGAPTFVPGDANDADDIFVIPFRDFDADGMTYEWEVAFGLNPDDAADALLDPDSDGRTNLQEFLSKTHPKGLASATRYFGEGASTDFFTTTFSLVNPNATDGVALLRFLTADQRVLMETVALPGRSRRTVVATDVDELAPAEFATSIEADQPLVIDRVMIWAQGQNYGSHLERAVTAPATTWYFAEGATHSGFDLFYLLANASATDADVRIRYLRPSGAPLEKTYHVTANSRLTVWVDTEQFGANGEALADTDVSAVVDVLNGVPIIAERAMYRTTGPQLFGAGHASAGVNAPATHWFFAEAATGFFFDTFLLLANPGPAPAQIRATYLFPTGQTQSKDYLIPAESRFNIWLDIETLPNFTPSLFDTAVSITLESTNGVPIIAERAMWWPGPTSDSWYEAHVSAGATATAPRWALAAGEHRADPAVDTYILIANTSAFDSVVDVTLLLETGARVTRGFTVAARSRFNLLAHAVFPEATGQRFGAIVESTEIVPAQLVVETAVYSSTGGVTWAAGGNALATPLP